MSLNMSSCNIISEKDNMLYIIDQLSAPELLGLGEGKGTRKSKKVPFSSINTFLNGIMRQYEQDAKLMSFIRDIKKNLRGDHGGGGTRKFLKMKLEELSANSIPINTPMPVKSTVYNVDGNGSSLNNDAETGQDHAHTNTHTKSVNVFALICNYKVSICALLLMGALSYFTTNEQPRRICS